MKRLYFLFLILCFTGCIHEIRSSVNEILCPKEIADKALFFAKRYRDSQTEYEFGGQDELRAIKIDCSGLVVNCYRYAVREYTEYTLPFFDASVKDFFLKYSIITNHPNPGDLIFMGDEDTDFPTHIAFYVKTVDDNIYFIDSTKKEAVEGHPSINGVTERFYNKNDKRFKSFAKIKLLKNRYSFS